VANATSGCENPELPLDCDIESACVAAREADAAHPPAVERRARARGAVAALRHLPHEAEPFCLLDEVDAPLDDANIGRFVRMLNEFKAKTQFIVITHNPRTTTEAADAGIRHNDAGAGRVLGRQRADARTEP
jgi:chromosome segregation protein